MHILVEKWILMPGHAPEIWIATSDGRDLVRVTEIVTVRLAGGRVTARLRGEASDALMLAEELADDQPPADFHRQLIRTIAELAEASGSQLVRAHHDAHGWRWVTEVV